MAFDEKTLIELVRSSMGARDNSHDIAITWAIPRALLRLARKVAADPTRRPFLMTVRSATPIAVVNNMVDLGAYNASADKRLLLTSLDVGDIYLESDPSRALEPADAATYQENAANHLFKDDYIWYWRDGNILRIFKSDASVINGVNITVSAPYVPKIAHIADIPGLHDLLVSKVIEILPEFSGADAAQDGEN